MAWKVVNTTDKLNCGIEFKDKPKKGSILKFNKFNMEVVQISENKNELIVSNPNYIVFLKEVK